MGKYTKDRRDNYYRKAKEDGYRARSAYKLIQINDIFSIFDGVERVIDLCAAPGSWSQVLSNKLKEKGYFQNFNSEEDVRIISIDLQEMAPIENTCQIVGDITQQETVNNIMTKFKGNKSELVVCDGAPDVTGFHDIDQYIQTQLLVASLNIANLVLKKNGNFVAKVFQGNDVLFLYSQFKYFFESVYLVKPESSRASSVEAFIVCLNYNPPIDFKPAKLSTFQEKSQQPQLSQQQQQEKKQEQEQKSQYDQKVFDFVTCGDLSGYDEDIDNETQ